MSHKPPLRNILIGANSQQLRDVYLHGAVFKKVGRTMTTLLEEIRKAQGPNIARRHTISHDANNLLYSIMSTAFEQVDEVTQKTGYDEIAARLLKQEGIVPDTKLYEVSYPEALHAARTGLTHLVDALCADAQQQGAKHAAEAGRG